MEEKAGPTEENKELIAKLNVIVNELRLEKGLAPLTPDLREFMESPDGETTAEESPATK